MRDTVQTDPSPVGHNSLREKKPDSLTLVFTDKLPEDLRENVSSHVCGFRSWLETGLTDIIIITPVTYLKVSIIIITP